jgi:hypothetical protein
VIDGIPRPQYLPVFRRIYAPGFDVSTTLGRFEIHGEGAFELVERNGRHDVFQGIVGMNVAFDRNCRNVPASP